jgi:octaprenyl-diphosphate synthase
MLKDPGPADSLREEIEFNLSSLKDAAGLSSVIKECLKPEGQKSVSLAWPLLPLFVCEAVCGRYDRAIPVAASIQFLRAAAGVFDDIEDADSAASLASRYGQAVAINAASALLNLANKSLLRLRLKGVPDSEVLGIIDTLSSGCIAACEGQHLDLSLSASKALTEETYLRIAYLKSASTVECACRAGALAAGAPEDLIDKFAGFGYNLGMMAQIANDLAGVDSGADIRKRKITLPAIYALANLDGDPLLQVEQAFVRPPEVNPDPLEIKDILFSSGAVYYAAVRMQLYHQAAQKVLNELGSDSINTGHLKEYLA